MNIKLDLDIKEVNLILASLAKQPYESVFEIIGKVRAQTTPQFEAAKEAEKNQPEKR